ncbi:MAG TPA: alpha/beta hydrolase [Paenibacillus sp.]|jgi:acetyl esterase/lipase
MCNLYTFGNKDGIELTARVYSLVSDKPAILYFHGGGLLCGEKDDLPKAYIQKFLDAGHPFITFDYRLAPEVDLPDLYTDVQDAVNWFQANYEQIGLTHHKFIYFGRSAGAYLTFLAAKDDSLPKPEKMISFYGYPRLDIEAFKSRVYQHVTLIPKALVDGIIGDKPVVYGPVHKRYALYLHARQTGTWIASLFHDPTTNLNDYQLSDEDLYKLPPTFIAQSRTDSDVPFYVSGTLHNQIPNSELFVVDQAEHDFDRAPSNPLAIEAYDKAIAFCLN